MIFTHTGNSNSTTETEIKTQPIEIKTQLNYLERRKDATLLTVVLVYDTSLAERVLEQNNENSIESPYSHLAFGSWFNSVNNRDISGVGSPRHSNSLYECLT